MRIVVLGIHGSLGRCSHGTASMSPFKLPASEGPRSIEDPTTSASGRNEMASQSIGDLET
jgi:hypothetical protein